MQHGEEHSAQHKNYERAGKRAPTVSEREITYPVIERREPVLPPLGHGWLQMLRRFDHVERNQWDEGESNNDGRDQRAGHNNRKAIQEEVHVAGQHQEREIGDDVRDSGKHNCLCQFGGPNPGCEIARGTGAQLAFDCVACHNGHVDQQPESDDQRRDRDLLDVDIKHVNDTEGHCQGQRNG